MADATTENEKMDDTLERVRKVIIELLGVEPEQVTPEARIAEDLDADSLDFVELEMNLEEEFEILFPDQTPVRLEDTVADMVRHVDELRGA